MKLSITFEEFTSPNERFVTISQRRSAWVKNNLDTLVSNLLTKLNIFLLAI